MIVDVTNGDDERMVNALALIIVAYSPLSFSRPYLTRHTKYDEDELLASKQIKLITGPRRTGKSTEALLMLKDRNFAWK